MPKYNEKHELKLTDPTQVSPAADQPPRISTSVTTAATNKEEKYQTTLVREGTKIGLGDPATFVASVKKLLNHLRERLVMGLEEAWLSPYGYDGPLPLPKPGDKPSTNELEEMWARIFAEMFVFAAYGGTAMVYTGTNSGNAEMPFYARLGPGQTDPVYPIVAPCQHIATFMAISRGLASDRFLPNGMTAGAGTKSLDVWKDGKWIVASTEVATEVEKDGKKTKVTSNKEDSTFRDLATLIGTHKLTPGSVFAYNSLGPDTPSQMGAAHIGSAIRILGADQIQAMDTGVLATGTDSGTLDHGIMKKQLGGMGGNLVGIGILPNGTLSEDQCKFLRTARPAGFAQLVLADDNDNVRYMSRLLPMLHGDDSFAISRYVWSLRDLPVDSTVRAYWILHVPMKKKLTDELLKAGARAKKLDELVTAAGMDPAKDRFMDFLKPVVVISTVKSGPVKVSRRKLDGAKDQWNGAPTASSTQFPEELKALRFADGPGGIYGKWVGFRLGAEYACADPSAKVPVMVKSLADDVEYFNGGQKAATPAPPTTSPTTPADPATPGSPDAPAAQGGDKPPSVPPSAPPPPPKD